MSLLAGTPGSNSAGRSVLILFGSGACSDSGFREPCAQAFLQNDAYNKTLQDATITSWIVRDLLPGDVPAIPIPAALPLLLTGLLGLGAIGWRKRGARGFRGVRNMRRVGRITTSLGHVRTLPGALLFAVALAMISAMALPASAATIYSQNFTPNLAQRSDVNATTSFVYDDFSLSSAATIKSVNWRGTDSPTPATTPDDFTIEFLNDTGLPGTARLGTSISTFAVGTAVNRTGTGQFFTQGEEFFEFTADISGGLSLAAGNYFLSIRDNSGSGSPWFWATNALLTDDGLFSSNGTLLTSTLPMYYSLDDAFVSNVPIPAALPLLLSGLLGLGAIGWRKRRNAA